MVHILVTNDDGIDSEGITVLAAALREVPGTQVTVVAPDRERSTVSHSLTLHKPLRVTERGPSVYSVDGTPSDAVFLGIAAILKTKPDFVFSGINRGGNLGDDVHYSGTVSAAVEGAIMGVPSVAISQIGVASFDFKMAGSVAQKMLRFVLEHKPPAHIVLNVNVPEKISTFDFVLTRTGKRDYGLAYEKRDDPRGRSYYWIGGNQYQFYDIADSDCNAVTQGKISITPLEINLTSFDYLKKMQAWKL